MTDLIDRMQGKENWQRREAASLREYSKSPSMPELAEMHEETADALKDARIEIERLREKCDKQTMILRRLNPENFPDTYFICGEAGERDQNGMPAKIMVAPAYGVDFAYEYVYNGEVRGPEW